MAKAKRPFYSLSLQKATVDRLRKIHREFEPRFSITGFVEDLLDVYKRSRCPECGRELMKKTCSCKEAEVC